MKTLRFITSVIIAALALSASADVTWLETTHDFGAFQEDLGPVSCQFRFVNTNPEPVAIVAARASCGCTTPQYPREAIAPGDTAVITVSYDPAARPGRFTKYIGVTLSDSEPMIKLYIEGSVVVSAQSVAQRFPAQCSPALQLAKGIVMTGDVAKGQLRTVFLEAYNRSTDTIRPKVTDMPPYFEATMSPEVVPPGEQMSFIFYFNSAKCPQYGIVNDTISIWPDAQAPEPCRIPSVALVREDFAKLSPKQLEKAPKLFIADSTLDFGRLADIPLTRTCTIKNIGKSPLIIRRLYTADRGISVAIDRNTVKPGKEAVITVTVNPAELTGALLNARIALICNDPYNANTSLRVVGEL